MSHVTDIKMRVRDLDALDEACRAVGLELRRGQKKYAWWGTFVGDSNAFGGHDPKKFGECEHAIRIPGTSPRDGSSGPWEIGVVKALDGDGYDLLFDTYGSAGQALNARVAGGSTTLKQEYAISTATKEARKRLAHKGFTVNRVSLADGRVRLAVRKR